MLGTFLLLLPSLSCAPRATYSDGIFRQGEVAFRVGPLPADWQRIGSRRARLAFRHRQGGTLIVNASVPARRRAARCPGPTTSCLA